MNQTEIDELRRLASVSREPRHGIGCIASDCALASAARNALPRLLAALEDARAERDKADAHIQQVHDWYADRWERLRAFLASGSLMEKGACDIMANGRLMIDAFPASPLALAVARAEGAEAERDALKAKLDEASRKVQEMCERIGRIHIADYVTESVEVCEGLDRIRAVLLDSRDMDALKMQLAAAKADRANLIRINRLLRDRPDLGDRAKTVDALIADYGAAETQAWDALGRPDGTHDTSNVQRLCEAHGALKEKLAALVTDIEAAMHFVNHTACLPVCGLYCTPPSRCTCGVNDIRNALAAAKVQP